MSEHTRPPRARLTIAISGKSGCGNSTVSRLVAERLGLRLINYTFHTIAEERGVSFEEVCRLAEKDDSYDRLVDRRQLRLASEGNCVLGSRLAIWLIEDADLRVYLHADLAVRAERIRAREGGEYSEVLAATEKRDLRDRARYLRLYDIDIDRFEFADMIIYANELSQFDVAERIVRRVAALGRPISPC